MRISIYRHSIVEGQRIPEFFVFAFQRLCRGI